MNRHGIESCVVKLAIAAVALTAIAVGAASLPILAKLEPSAHADHTATAPKAHAAAKCTAVGVMAAASSPLWSLHRLTEPLTARGESRVDVARSDVASVSFCCTRKS